MSGVEEETISFSVIAWIPRIIFLIAVISVMVIMVYAYSRLEINSSKPDSEIFVYRLINSPNGLSYYDSVSGRVYPGIIDLNKFSSSSEGEYNIIPSLQNSISYGDDKHIGAQIVIYDLNKIPLAKAYYNPYTYQRIAESGILGPGGVDVVSKQIYVLSKKGADLIPSIMNIEIVVERSR